MTQTSGSEPRQDEDPAPVIFDELASGLGDPLEPGMQIPDFEPWGLVPPPPLADMLAELKDSVDNAQLLHDAEAYVRQIGRHAVEDTGEGEA